MPCGVTHVVAKFGAMLPPALLEFLGEALAVLHLHHEQLFFVKGAFHTRCGPIGVSLGKEFPQLAHRTCRRVALSTALPFNEACPLIAATIHFLDGLHARHSMCMLRTLRLESPLVLLVFPVLVHAPH